MKGLSMLLFLAACHLAACISTVPELAIDSYLGRWYLMYTSLTTLVFQSRNCVQAEYSLNPNGTVRVRNADRPTGVDGPLRTIEGYAIRSETEPGQLSVIFPTTSEPGSYWVVGLGPIEPATPATSTQAGQPGAPGQYQYAIVSDSRQLTLFVLARNVTDFNQRFDADVRPQLNSLGFNRVLNRPLPVTQAGCPPVPFPLPEKA